MQHLLVALILGALAPYGAPPSPAPTPLKTIVRERVSPFCTQVRQTIGGAVIGLMHNDEWAIGKGGFGENEPRLGFRKNAPRVGCCQ